MNNVIGAQAPYSIDGITKLLEPELVKLLQDLKADVIPAASQCEMLCNLLVKYTETVQLASCKAQKKDSTKRICFTDHAGDAKDKSLLQNENVINILCWAGLEKLVSTRDIGVEQELLRQLVDANLVADISAEADHGNDDYFTLTTKGWNWLESKEFQKKARNSLPAFPTQLGIEANLWSELTFLRAKMIHDYYHEYPTAHGYIMFAFPQNKQLLFGCEISETVDVSYVCPYAFDEAPLEEDVDTLCEILGVSEVKTLTIVSADAIGLNDMPTKFKNAVAAVAANVAFIKLRN